MTAVTRTERLNKLRKALQSRRDELRNRSGSSYSESNDTNPAFGDAADIAQYNVSSDLDTHLISMEADELSEIELALKKFQEGKYGVCEFTGRPIPIARLEAMPLTRYSVEAQRESEKSSRW